VLLSGVMSNSSGCKKYVHNHQLVISCYQHVLTAVNVLFSFSLKISIRLTHYEDAMSVCPSEDVYHINKRDCAVMLKPDRLGSYWTKIKK
jgi:hypothetical protein